MVDSLSKTLRRNPFSAVQPVSDGIDAINRAADTTVGFCLLYLSRCWGTHTIRARTKATFGEIGWSGRQAEGGRE